LDVSKKDILEMQQRMASRDLSLDAPIDDNRELTHFDLMKETPRIKRKFWGKKRKKRSLRRESG